MNGCKLVSRKTIVLAVVVVVQLLVGSISFSTLSFTNQSQQALADNSSLVAYIERWDEPRGEWRHWGTLGTSMSQLELELRGTESQNRSTTTIVRYEWDFGDGDTAEGEYVTHTYIRGSYDISLTVYDDEGNSASETLKIEVRGNIPTSSHTQLLTVMSTSFDSITDLNGAKIVTPGSGPYLQWLQTALATYGISFVHVVVPTTERLTALRIGVVDAVLVTYHPSPYLEEPIASGEVYLLPWSVQAVEAVTEVYPGTTMAAQLPPNTYEGQTGSILGYAPVATITRAWTSDTIRGPEVTNFPAGTEKVYVNYGYVNPLGSVQKIVWYDSEGNVIGARTHVSEHRLGTGTWSLTYPGEEFWPGGSYSAELFINDVLLETAGWTVELSLTVPRFLTLPFSDPNIKVQEGWVYHWPNPPTHQGIDYIKGEVDDSSTWQPFDVVAAADGWALWSEEPGSTYKYGQFILLQHEEPDNNGNRYFTLYAHLASVASGIPYQDRYAIEYDTSNPSNWKYVKRGEVIGTAGNTGASNTGIHLHFEVTRGGYAQNMTDPYDLYQTRYYYPGYSQYASSGPHRLWTTDPPNFSPIAQFIYSPGSLGNPVYSGVVVSFDGLSSYDPDGTILSYEWDFGDGETDTGRYVTHRFRGSPDGLRTYNVTLTVEDDKGAKASDIQHVLVDHLKKPVKVIHEPMIPKPGVTVFAEIEVLYNWIDERNGEDVYIVSGVVLSCDGFSGFYSFNFIDTHSRADRWRTPTVHRLLWWSSLSSRVTEKTYGPESFEGFEFFREKVYGNDVFRGIEVYDSDIMFIAAYGYAGIQWDYAAPFIEWNSRDFRPESAEAPSVPIDINDLNLAHLSSSGELRVYDSQGRVTGSVNGVLIEEIPYSFSFDNTVVIPAPTTPHHYEVTGTQDGSYGLVLASIEDGEANVFTAVRIPTASGAIHQYSIDWDDLSQGEDGVTVQIDSDGDGVFDRIITVGSELTGDEFILQTATVIDFDPDTLNLASKGKFVTVYVELPPGYEVGEIDVATVMLNGTVPALNKPTQVGDYDGDGVPDLMVKFDRDAVQSILAVGEQVEITITGEVAGVTFEGTDTIRVIDE